MSVETLGPPNVVTSRGRGFRGAFDDAWRGITGTEVAWTFAAGLVFTIAHAYALNVAPGRSWPFPMRLYEWSYPPLCLIFLIAFRMAEHPRFAAVPAWRRYAAAIPVAATLYAICTAAVTVAATSEKHADMTLLNGFTWGFLLDVQVSAIVAVVYSSVIRSRRAQAAFDAAALGRAAVRRQVIAARLAALQARVDPAFLFSTLELLETLYDRDLAAAEQALAALIDYLRTALPSVTLEGSTLGRELQLARMYLAITGVRMGSRLQVDVQVDPQLERATFPPMLIVPIVEHAVSRGLEPLAHGGRLAIAVLQQGARLRVEISHNGIADRDAHWIDPLRARLAELHASDATLSLAGGDSGFEATIDVPYEQAAALPNADAIAQPDTTRSPA